jgi:hypothetical protein
MAFRHSDPNFKRRAPYSSMSTASASIVAAAHAAHKRSMSRFTSPAGGSVIPSSHTTAGAFLPDIALRAAEMAFDKQMMREQRAGDHRSSHTHSAPPSGRSGTDATGNAGAAIMNGSVPILSSDHPSSSAAAAAAAGNRNNNKETTAQHQFTAELEDELAQVRGIFVFYPFVVRMV